MQAITAAISSLPSAQQREWAESRAEWIAEHKRQPADALDLVDRWTPEHRDAIHTALVVYASSATDARDVLRAITGWSRRLGVLLACAVARESLRYVPEGEDRPRIAIETAERWVRGEATAEECRHAGPTTARATTKTEQTNMNLTWIKRADGWHQAELGRVALIVVRVGSRWSARVGAVIETDRSELLFEREVDSCGEAKRVAEALLVENLSTVLERVAERARNHAIEQCAGIADRAMSDYDIVLVRDALRSVRAQILALST